MLMKIDECVICGKIFTFDTSQCSQIIAKQDDKSLIYFLPKCPHCQGINSIEIPWEKYNVIDY